MILVTLATMTSSSKANVSALQTLHFIIPKFFAIHEEQRVAQGIYHYVE